MNITFNNRLLKPFFIMALISFAGMLHAQDQPEEKEKTMDIYGHIMLDAGYNFNQINQNWYDVMRPTQLPSYDNQYGPDGNYFASVRQTRLGFKNYVSTPLGQLKTQFEFELFGTGVDAGQTTFRLRHAYAELGHFGAGQTWSPFMDIDVFPNTLEYWGPNGMVFFRNIQVRYFADKGNNHFAVALEKPGASGDQGVYSDRVELDNVAMRFALPDLSAEYRRTEKWGYVELAGILRKIEWKDQNNDAYNLSGDALAWGLNLSTNLKLGSKSIFRGQVVYGEGIENYMNDAPVDVGIKKNPGNVTSPVEGVALPVLGVVAFLDHNWNEKFSSSLGYSLVNIDNSDGQANDAFKRGQYIAANILYSPVKNVTTGIEYQWGSRENFNDGWDANASKIQVSFKYNFSQSFYK